MEVRLAKISTYGMKNINKMIEIDFLNETTSRKITNYNVKGIFGRNGSGKSAILASIHLYKMILQRRGYLSETISRKNIISLINKERKEFYFKAYILCTENNVSRMMSHEILIKSNGDEIYIDKENLSLIKGQTINSLNSTIIYKIEKGVIKEYQESFYNRFLENKTINILYYSSLISVSKSSQIKDLVNELAEYEKTEYDIDYYVNCYTSLAKKIKLYLEPEDNIEFKNSIYLDSPLELLEIKTDRMPLDFDIHLSSEEDVILNDNFDKYKKYIDKLAKFIKLFKPDLKGIEIETSIDREFIHCKKILNYGNYKIESSNESKGIRKIIRLYSYLNMAVEGYFVFIDELDSSINNVILDKLLEFFIEYGKGILCFTSHSLEPINALKKKAKSILFLGQESNLVVWTKKGNSNPINYYKDGYVEWSTYNIDYFDFLRVFNMEIL